MSAEEKKQVVLDFIEVLKQEDYEGLANLLGDDFQWVVPARSPTLKMLTEPRDKEFSVGRMKANRDLMTKPLHFEPFGWTIDGDRVAVECEGEVVWANGMEYNNLYHLLFVVRDGKIRKLVEYTDFLYAWETNPLLPNPANKKEA